MTRALFSDTDEFFMRHALQLAQRAKGLTFPNPAVGAVVVEAGGKIVGEGATGVCGGPHAERRAIKKAGAAARGGTMFVTLEPCAHTGRTPPCTDAIIEAGINKVVVAAKDPNPLVSGRGLRQLKVRGVTVRTGLLAREAALVNEDFFWSVINRRPWVSLKLAMTLDGRIADFQGGSKWITSPAARREVQEIRRRHGAVAVGGGTLAADDPKLTARCGNKNYYPARIVFSTGGDIPKNCYFRTRSSETRSIVVIKGCGERRIDRDRHGPIEYWHTGAGDDAETISAFLDMAYAEGLASILVEGGQRLASSFLENGFVNKVYLFYGNKIFGNGKNGLLFSQGLSVANSINLSKVNRHYFGGDFLVSGYVGRADSAL